MFNPFDSIDALPDAPVTGSVTPTRLLSFDPNIFPAQAPVENDLCAPEKFNHVPLNPEVMTIECPMFEHAKRTGGEGQSQGVWMNMALACTFLHDGQELFHRWSAGHKGYDPAKAEEMWERKLSESAVTRDDGLRWPSCQSFENFGCTQCATCPMKGKIHSPLNLAAPVTQQTPPPSPHVPLTPFRPSGAIHLPPGYRPVTGPYGPMIVYQDTKSDDSFTVFKNGILRAYVERGEDRMQKLWFEVTVDLGRTEWVEVTNAETGDASALVRSLAQQQCKVACNAAQMRNFMVSWLEVWHSLKRAPRGVQFGWLKNEQNSEVMEGFAYGGFMYYPDGTRRRVGVRANQRTETYKVTGREKPWRRLMEQVILPDDRPDIEALIATSFAAPLMNFTNLYNGVLYVYSASTGRSKSTAMALACAVWASPVASKAKVTSSALGMSGEIAALRNLPFFLDEVTEAGKLDAVAKMIPVLTEGGQEYKNRPDGTPRPRGKWQTTLTIAGNRSLWEVIRADAQTDASLARVLELKIRTEGTERYNPHDVLDMTNVLDDNYGHLGARYAEYLARNYVQIQKMVKDYDRWFSEKVGRDKRFRFWEGMSGGIVMGARLANMFCGVGFHEKRIEQFLLDYNRELREAVRVNSVVGGREDNVRMAVNEFQRLSQSTTAWTDIFPLGPGRCPKVEVDRVPDPQYKSLTMRFAWKDKVMVIARTPFEDFLRASPRYGVETTMEGLHKVFGATEHVVSIGRGLKAYSLSRENVIVVPVPNEKSEWWDALTANRPTNDNNEASPDEAQSA